ncbi:unnamed protein product [Paramecium octaurelia]|uniref:Uncharacterized protein n=1 Tax=Paramecium octaurelia TaxID=43137 RepID=A0A8S1W4N4_PAROT|nr:unnamed protein product [Paramecium octaurelia]
MQQKSKTLLHLLQQQQHYHDDINTSLESNFKHSSEHTEKKFDLKLQKSVVELYQQIKSSIQKTEDQLLLCQIKKVVPLDKQEDLYTDPISLICYIGCIFSIVLQNKFNLEQQIEDHNSRNQNDYEEQLIKLEAEIRQHIRIEQQLKLFAENTQSKLEDVLKIKDDLEEELQTLKNEFQILNEKNNTLNQKLKIQEKDIQNIKLNSKVDLNSQNIKFGQQSKKTQLDKDNIENEFMKQQTVSLNGQKDKFKCLGQEYENRLRTEPQDDYIKFRNNSQKRIFSTHISNNNNNNNNTKSNNQASRVQTETSEYPDKNRKSNLSNYETSQVTINHQRNQTTQNVLNLINQEFKRQQSIKGCSEKSTLNSTKPQKKASSSQHTEANRSNNSVHSFRKQPQEVIQIPRPFSCAEQIEEAQHSLRKDISVDLNGQQKLNADYLENQLQIKKLLQQYQQKHSLNDNLTKKLLQEYKKRSGYNCKTIY